MPKTASTASCSPHPLGWPPEAAKQLGVGRLLPALTLPLGKLERHLNGARPHLAAGDEEFIRATARQAAALPALDHVVPTHGDFQLLH
ncbi:hypothetical protein ACWGOK_25715 [Streptomyces eurythermus]